MRRNLVQPVLTIGEVDAGSRGVVCRSCMSWSGLPAGLLLGSESLFRALEVKIIAAQAVAFHNEHRGLVGEDLTRGSKHQLAQLMIFETERVKATKKQAVK